MRHYIALVTYKFVRHSNQNMNLSESGLSIREIIMKVLAFMVFSVMGSLSSGLHAQGLSIGHVSVCNDSIVMVPLTGNNLSNIGAITLYIDYNKDSLTFQSIENIDPQLSGIMANVLPDPARISIVWSKTAGASFLNSTLLDLKFRIMQQTGDLVFVKGDCEIATVSPPISISVNYSDGFVFNSVPVISSEPENQTVPSQSNAIFQLSSPNASGFIWQESQTSGALWSDLPENGTYTGTKTNILTIKQVHVNFNSFRYRCKLSNNGCSAVSTAAVLSVDSVAGLDVLPGQNFLQLSNNPNPFSEKTTLEYVVPENGQVTVKIFSLTGNIMETLVEKTQPAGRYRLEDKFVYLPAGIYLCMYTFTSPYKVFETCRKMIKLNQK